MKDMMIYVENPKGGSGKSMVALPLIQYLIDRYAGHKTVHLVETDPINPDMGRVYQGRIPVTPIILDKDETGWITLTRLLQREANKDTIIVINGSAYNGEGIQENGPNLSDIFEAGLLPSYQVAVLWPMTTLADCVDLLESFLNVIQCGAVFPIRNLKEGKPTDFTLFEDRYRSSELFQRRITKVLDLPKLNSTIAQEVRNCDLPIPLAIDKIGIYEVQSLKRWQAKVYDMLESTGLFDETEETPSPQENKKSRKKSVEEPETAGMAEAQ